MPLLFSARDLLKLRRSEIGNIKSHCVGKPGAVTWRRQTYFATMLSSHTPVLSNFDNYYHYESCANGTTRASYLANFVTKVSRHCLRAQEPPYMYL